MNDTAPSLACRALVHSIHEPDFAYSVVDLLTWLGEGKRLIAGITLAAAVVLLAYALTRDPIYTARTSLLPPNSQQQSGSPAALAALGLLAGVDAKTPDEFYLALLKSDSVTRALDKRFNLKAHYQITTNEALRKALPQLIRKSYDSNAGVINIAVDDSDPKFAADLANAQAGEVNNLLGRLAVSEAQQRRVFFEQQLNKTKEDLAKAEVSLRRVQSASGVILLDKQTETLLTDAAQVRARIAEREVQLKVLRTGATEQNRDVIDVHSELRALRTELAHMEAAKGDSHGSAVDMPVSKIPEIAIEYMRASRELKLKEALMESTAFQLERARLDEARGGPVLKQIDLALPIDGRSNSSRASPVVGGALLALFASAAWVAIRRCASLDRERDPAAAAAWRVVRRAWRLRA